MSYRVQRTITQALAVFVAIAGVGLLCARIDSEEELRNVLVLDCFVGLGLFGYLALGGNHSRRTVRRTWLRLAVGVVAGLAVALLLAWMHIAQVETRKSARDSMQQLERIQAEPAARPSP